MKYKCIIFDCDGVLVDSELITNKVVVEMANQLGVSLDLNFVVKEFLGKSLNDIMKFLDTKSDAGLSLNFEQEYRRRTFEAFVKELKPINGISKLLDKLEVPYCVASSGPLSKIRHNLSLVGLLKRFEGRIFSCYEINSWKPNPDIFLYAAKNMGFKPSECVVIEDSEVGVTAALEGGFDVFLYAKDEDNKYSNIPNLNVFNDMNILHSLLSK